MQDKAKKANQITDLTNTILTDLKILSGTLKPISNTIYERNNAIMNKLLIAKQQDTSQIIKKILEHCLHIAEYKDFANNSLSIITKMISSVKNLHNIQDKNDKRQQQQMQQILTRLIDIVCLISVQQGGQDISLRVVQVSFSLIDQTLMKYFSNSLLTRLYSVFFEQCKVSPIVKNICISALFALTQCLFIYGKVEESFSIVISFLKYLFKGEKFTWIKGKDVKGLVFDLVVVSVKNFTANHLIQLQHKQTIKKVLQEMYQISTSYIFLNKQKDFYASIPQNNNRNSTNVSHISDFVRYFKVYVSFSSSLSIQAYRVIGKQYVPFRPSIQNLILICDLQRNSRMFIFLQAICQLLLNQYDIPLSVDKGMILMQILSRISEQLCLCNQAIKVNWQQNQYYIDKICYDEPKVTAGDFVRLLKHTLFQLRHKYEKDEDLMKCKQQAAESARSISNFPQKLGNAKKWEIFTKSIIRMIRYLSSLNFVPNEHEEEPTRKIVLQLQYWFLICPVYRAKNMILQQLLVNSTLLTNKMQAIKVSQCVQIGSNILYGYYENLDSIGLTIIMKMMAGVKADWEEGKSFEQLDQIYNLSLNIFKQQKLIKTENSFSMTIQALVQCANSLIADLQQPKQKLVVTTSSPLKRQHKMIQYIIEKLIAVVKNNIKYVANQWNFVSAFFITLCYSRNNKIREDGIQQIGKLVNCILKSDEQTYATKKQQDILGLYLELSKSHIKQIDLQIIQQLKSIMPRIKQQAALMDGFRIAKIFSQSEQQNKQIISGIHQLQEILIKQCLFRIVDRKYLRMVLDGIQVKFSEKNEEYRLVGLYWGIADHFKQITPRQQISNQFLELWEGLFKSIYNTGLNTQESETKQSVIHALTQILAQACNILPFDFILLIMSKYYQSMILVLLGLHPASYIETQKVSQTSKIALKNSVKIFKKLLSHQQKTVQQKNGITKNINAINQSIKNYMEEQAKNKQTGNITVELLYEIAGYISGMLDDKTFSQYQIDTDLKQMFIAIQDIIKMQQEFGENLKNSKIDLKSHLYRKKLKPLMDKMNETHTKSQNRNIQENQEIKTQQEQKQ